jgi:hypothetical protein
LKRQITDQTVLLSLSGVACIRIGLARLLLQQRRLGLSQARLRCSKQTYNYVGRNCRQNNVTDKTPIKMAYLSEFDPFSSPPTNLPSPLCPQLGDLAISSVEEDNSNGFMSAAGDEGEQFVYDPNLLKALDISERATFKTPRTPANPGEGLKMRPLGSGDFEKGKWKQLNVCNSRTCFGICHYCGIYYLKLIHFAYFCSALRWRKVTLSSLFLCHSTDPVASRV